MRNAIFPSFQPSLTSFGTTEIQMSNSYISPEIERSNSYSSSPLYDLQTSNFSWLGDFNYLSGERNEDFPSFLYDNPSNESVTAGNSLDKEVLEKTQERNCSSDVKEKESRFNKSKRRKILDREDGQGSQALATGQQIKAPVKRSQKLGDKVTALQQLVSPFGKTDTASVLQEASVYIKFLQEQIEVLSTPYFRYRTSMDPKAEKEDGINLRSRGLCLIPISSTVDLTKEAGNGHISTGKTSGSRR